MILQKVKGTIDKMYKSRRATGLLVFVDISEYLIPLQDHLLKYAGKYSSIIGLGLELPRSHNFHLRAGCALFMLCVL